MSVFYGELIFLNIIHQP